MDVGMRRLEAEFGQRELDTVQYRAKEIAAFLRLPWGDCLTKLESGFGPLHNAVTEDFNRVNPVSDRDLYNWYMGTDSYIWELTAYHLDAGFNYAGMTRGITEALKSKGVERVLCLGDGTGDLSLVTARTGMKAIYNDLRMSRTDQFAQSRFSMRLGDRWGKSVLACSSGEFVPFFHIEDYCETLDAVVSLDFLEHVPNVEEWVKAVYYALRPGGYFVAQNAFNMGSGVNGSMPMHLSMNDHYDTDWDPLLFSLGFTQLASNWYQKPA
jgi:SAM-dependent methyltransferase